MVGHEVLLQVFLIVDRSYGFPKASWHLMRRIPICLDRADAESIAEEKFLVERSYTVLRRVILSLLLNRDGTYQTFASAVPRPSPSP